MKIALYVEDGLEQIVLTPESEAEEDILSKIHDDSRELSIKRGEFYGCRGGYTRWKKQYNSPYYSDQPNDESTIIVLRRRAEINERAREASSSDGSSRTSQPLNHDGKGAA